jgi:amino acid permease
MSSGDVSEKDAPALQYETLEQQRKDGESEGDTLETVLGYKPELHRNRSLFTLLFQSLAIAAIPYGDGAPIISAIYGGGQVSIWVGWLICNLLTQATAMSLAELASKYPTSGGPPYWAFQVAPRGKTLAAFITGWVYLIGNWTITLRCVSQGKFCVHQLKFGVV